MSKKSAYRALLVAAGLTVASCTGVAAGEPTPGLEKGKMTLDVRYRYETVDDDGAKFTDEARASTIRARFGGRTDYYYYFRGVVEVEAVGNIGDDYFNNTANGRGYLPVVADVEVAEINQAHFEFVGLPDTVIKGGRVVQTLDNHRFLGHVGWRQNMQSYDGVFVTNKSLDKTEIFYGYIGNVNRIFGENSIAQASDFEGENHIVRVKNKSLPIGTVGGYAYMFDNNTAKALSSGTYGGYISGKRKLRDDLTLGWYFEYANQSDYGDQPVDYEADYYHIAPFVVLHGVKVTVGYEVLGSDNGVKAVTTPYATLHKFNGWADKFLVTPNDGLQDFYVDVTYKVKGMNGPLAYFNGTLLKAQYHTYESDFGSTDYGTEYGFYSKTPLGKGFYMESKHAFYEQGDDASRADAYKGIFGIGFKY